MRLPTYSAVRQELNTLQTAQSNGSPFGCLSSTYMLSHSAFGMAVMAMLNIIPVSMIVVGFLNLDECAAQPNLPRWLIWMGVLLIVKYLVDTAVNIYRICRHRESNHSIYHFSPAGWVFTAIFIIWLTVGAYWLHSAYGAVQHTMEEYSDYCDLLTFGAVFVIICFVAAAVALLSCCSCLCCAMLSCKTKVLRKRELDKRKRNSPADVEQGDVRGTNASSNKLVPIKEVETASELDADDPDVRTAAPSNQLSTVCALHGASVPPQTAEANQPTAEVTATPVEQL